MIRARMVDSETNNTKSYRTKQGKFKQLTGKNYNMIKELERKEAAMLEKLK